MPFPLIHLLVADELLACKSRSKNDAAQFLLGSLGPDAVHYREFLPEDKNSLGPAKKITHLCPVSDERWGQVTDNEGWIESVRDFVKESEPIVHHEGSLPQSSGATHPLQYRTRSFIEGYAVHALTDLHNNKTIWSRFRTYHPDEAAKGYKSDYYQDLISIDRQLYQTSPQVSRIWELLAEARPCDMPGLVSEEEIRAIHENILHEYCQGLTQAYRQEYKYVTYEELLAWVNQAVDFIESVLDF